MITEMRVGIEVIVGAGLVVAVGERFLKGRRVAGLLQIAHDHVHIRVPGGIPYLTPVIRESALGGFLGLIRARRALTELTVLVLSTPHGRMKGT